MTAPARVVIAVQVEDGSQRFLPTVRSLRAAHPEIPIVVGTPDPRWTVGFASLSVEVTSADSLCGLVSSLWYKRKGAIAVVSRPVIVPAGFLDAALAVVEGDIRVASVSFFSNAAYFLSFPMRNHPTPTPEAGFDEASITELLRTIPPAPKPTPIPLATGAVVLLGAGALSVVGPPQDNGPRFADAVAEFSARAQNRGFIDVLDPSTFVTHPLDLSSSAAVDTWYDQPDLPALYARHPQLQDVVQEAITSPTSPLGLAISGARTKMNGLTIVIDGSCIGPQEMGTQVQTIAVIEALAGRSDVSTVMVSANGPIPGYAGRALAQPKVDWRRRDSEQAPAGELADVVHRTFQPDAHFDVRRFRNMGARVLVTIQDLIAYRVGAYHPSSDAWLAYRHALTRAVAEADGVIAVSHDTAEQIAIERLPVDPTRLFVVENGTDHLSGEEAARIPDRLLETGNVAGDFLVTLGTNYAHKNRDVAIRAWRVLRERGLKLGLVIVGAPMPVGSSRVAEAVASDGDGDGLLVLPDVTSSERNWLLQHARALLYPSSAEGFGLIPYEAARFGTPAVLVSFGPIDEVLDLPVSCPTWDPVELADATMRLLTDPSLAERQIEAVRQSEHSYTWAATAAKLTIAYRTLLDRPPAASATPGDPSDGRNHG